MGMYDHVNFKCKCPSCDAELIDWQTKDGDRALELIEIEEIRHLNSICTNCDAYVSIFKILDDKTWRISWQYVKDADDIVASFIDERNNY